MCLVLGESWVLRKETCITTKNEKKMKEEWKKEKVRSPIREGKAPMSCSCNSPNSLTALQCRPYLVSWTLNFSLTHYFSRFPVTYFLHMVYSSFDFFFWSCFPAESHEWQWHWKVFILLSSALWLTPFPTSLIFYSLSEAARGGRHLHSSFLPSLQSYLF